MFRRRKNIGIAALPTILLISSILVEVVVVGVVLANALNNSRFSERVAAEAYAAANAGAEDAILRIIRYKNCPATPGCPSSYSLAVGSRSADVSIVDSGGGVITIQSTGTASMRKKKIEVILGASSNTGEVSLQSFREVSL